MSKKGALSAFRRQLLQGIAALCRNSNCCRYQRDTRYYGAGIAALTTRDQHEVGICFTLSTVSRTLLEFSFNAESLTPMACASQFETRRPHNSEPNRSGRSYRCTSRSWKLTHGTTQCHLRRNRRNP